jgi:hypothetical protein
VYVSDESGRNEVYVQSFPVLSSKWQASTNGGTRPRWRPDGRELFYVSRQRKLILVRWGEEESMPSTLSAIPGRGSYAIADGGRRVLARVPVTAFSRGIHVAVNWAEELRK